METDKIVLHVSENAHELTIKHGTAENPDKPQSLTLSGILKAPAAFLTAKKELLKSLHCHVIIDSKKLQISFITDETSVRGHKIVGTLEQSEVIKLFGINNDMKFKEKELAKLLRRTPFLFADKAAHAKLISQLLNFSATITTIVENNSDNKGNVKQLLEKSVSTQIMDSITFNCPIFKGESALSFKVFICCEATTNSVEFYLDSPDLYELEESERDRLLTEQASIFEEWGCAIIHV